MSEASVSFRRNRSAIIRNAADWAVEALEARRLLSVAFLAGPEASYITGHVLRVNGGLLM